MAAKAAQRCPAVCLYDERAIDAACCPRAAQRYGTAGQLRLLRPGRSCERRDAPRCDLDTRAGASAGRAGRVPVCPESTDAGSSAWNVANYDDAGVRSNSVNIRTAVILSAAKDLRTDPREILRCAQDDRWWVGLAPDLIRRNRVPINYSNMKRGEKCVFDLSFLRLLFCA